MHEFRVAALRADLASRPRARAPHCVRRSRGRRRRVRRASGRWFRPRPWVPPVTTATEFLREETCEVMVFVSRVGVTRPDRTCLGEQARLLASTWEADDEMAKVGLAYLHSRWPNPQPPFFPGPSVTGSKPWLEAADAPARTAREGAGGPFRPARGADRCRQDARRLPAEPRRIIRGRAAGTKSTAAGQKRRRSTPSTSRL